MATLLKIRQNIESCVYENTIQLTRTTKNKDATQEEYEDVDTPATHTIPKIIERVKTEPNKYIDWEDRKQNEPCEMDEQACDPRHNFTMQDPKLPDRQLVTAKWKIITLIFVILCVGLTASLVTVVVVWLSVHVQLQNVSRECDDIQSTESGVYTIYPDGIKPVSVYCIMADNETWTVIQHRAIGLVDFYRTWKEYKDGFGSANGEYWLGNDNIHLISTSSAHTLAIYMEDFDEAFIYANYSIFFIGDEHRKYQLTAIGFNASANVGDSLSSLSGRPFSSKDNDNSGSNCLERSPGAWWYLDCSDSNLNGPYLGGKGKKEAKLEWPTWRLNYSLKKTTMMVRRASFV